MVRRPRVEGAHFAADHHGNDLVRRQLGGLGSSHGAAVPEHRDPVRDLEHLLQAMADVDAGHAGGLELEQQAHEARGVGLGEGGGGLVQDEDPRLLGQRLADLHQLLLADAELLDRARGVHLETHELQRGLRVLAHHVPADEAGAHGLAAEGEVLHHRQLGHQGQLLGDERDAVMLGVPEGLEAHRRPVQEDLASISPPGVDAAERLDERALARAVLAAEDVDLALLQRERHAVQGAHAREVLGDVAELEQRHRGRYCFGHCSLGRSRQMSSSLW